MSSANEISVLQNIMVKPMSWRVLQSVDGSYTLAFTYVNPERSEYAEVVTRRGVIKVYKSVKAVIADISRVQQDSVVYLHSLTT